jgi:hypothetical protein
MIWLLAVDFVDAVLISHNARRSVAATPVPFVSDYEAAIRGTEFAYTDTDDDEDTYTMTSYVIHNSDNLLNCL